jgi:hypothetical protein
MPWLQHYWHNAAMLQHHCGLNVTIATTKLLQRHPSSTVTKVTATTTPLQLCYQNITTTTMNTTLLQLCRCRNVATLNQSLIA